MFDPGQHCRIGRVRMKDGGGDFRILARPSLSPIGERLVEYARTQAVDPNGPMAGFVLVTWVSDGGYQISADVHDGPIPLTLLPAWIEEIVRRELVTARQIHNTLEQDYEVSPPRRPPA